MAVAGFSLLPPVEGPAEPGAPEPQPATPLCPPGAGEASGSDSDASDDVPLLLLLLLPLPLALLESTTFPACSLPACLPTCFPCSSSSSLLLPLPLLLLLLSSSSSELLLLLLRVPF